VLAVLILAASNRGSNRPWCHIHAVVGCLAADERPASGKVPSVLGHRLEHRGLVIGLVVLVGLSAAAALAAQVLFDPYSVPSSSMAPAVGPGDRVLAWSYVWGGPQRGDIVIFEPPPAASADGATFPSVIGRVVGVGGDLIGFANGELMVNGQVPDERYLAAGTVTNGRASVEVPSGSIYVLGDSRETAQDSRSYGPVPNHNVQARVAFTNVPLDWITLSAVVAVGAALVLVLLRSASDRRDLRRASSDPRFF
jgi:signal peptidase I